MPFPVDLKYVKATEVKLGVCFPLGFVARMARLNGGEMAADGEHWDLYPFFDTSDRKRLKRTSNDIVHETRWNRTHAAGFPGEAIAIAGNGSGDQLVFLPKPQEPGRLQDAVYFWSHETGEVGVVADDFSEIASGEPGNGSEQRRGRPTRG